MLGARRWSIPVSALLLVLGLASGASADDVGRTLTGVVTGDGQRPVAGATVLVSFPGRSPAEAPVEITTGDDGRWSVPVTAGEVVADISAPGYYSVADRPAVRRSDSTVHLDRRLLRPATVRGTSVLTPGTAQPRHVALTLSSTVAGQDKSVTFDGSARAVETDVRPGWYRVHVRTDDTHVGTPSTDFVEVGSGAVVDLTATVRERPEPGTLAIDTTGLQHRTITVARVDPRPGESRGHDFDVSDRRGPIVLDESAPGGYQLRVEDAWVGGRSRETATVFQVRSGRTTSVSPRLPAQAMGVAVAPVNAAGRPLEDISITLRRAASPTEVIASVVTTQHQGSDLYLEQVPRDEYLVELEDLTGEYRPRTYRYRVDTAREAVMTRAEPFTPEPTGEKSARFTLDRLVDGLDTWPWSPRLVMADDRGVQVLAKEVAVDGDQRTWSVPPGRYKLQLGVHAWSGGSSFRSADVIDARAGGTVEVPWERAPTGRLTLRATTESGVVRYPLSVTVFPADDSTYPTAALWSDGTPSAVDQVALTRYKIRVSDPLGRHETQYVGGGSSFASARTFTPDPAGTLALGTVRLRTKAHLVSAPTVTGATRRGSTLTSRTPLFAPSGSTVKRQWYRDGRAIRGATGSRLRLTSSDVGKRITVRVTVSGTSRGSDAARSVPTATVRR